MGLSPDDLERKLLLVERQLKSLKDQINSESAADFLDQNLGESEVAFSAGDHLVLQPIFPQTMINAAAVQIGALRDNSGGGGTVKLQLGLYVAEFPNHADSFPRDTIAWGFAATLRAPTVPWRLVMQSDIVSFTDDAMARVRWAFPREVPMRPGGPIYGLGIIGSDDTLRVRGRVGSFTYLGTGTLGQTIGALPYRFVSQPTGASSSVSLSLLSKRGINVLGL